MLLQACLNMILLPQPFQKSPQKLNKLGYKTLCAKARIREYFNMMKLFIFQTGRIQRHRIAVFVLNKLIGLFLRKLGKYTLHHRLQPVKRTVHLDTEIAMNIGRSIFQNDCIHDGEAASLPRQDRIFPDPRPVL